MVKNSPAGCLSAAHNVDNELTLQSQFEIPWSSTKELPKIKSYHGSQAFNQHLINSYFHLLLLQEYFPQSLSDRQQQKSKNKNTFLKI